MADTQSSAATLRCEREASCEPGDHTYTWPCELAAGTGSIDEWPDPTEDGYQPW